MKKSVAVVVAPVAAAAGSLVFGGMSAPESAAADTPRVFQACPADPKRMSDIGPACVDNVAEVLEANGFADTKDKRLQTTAGQMIFNAMIDPRLHPGLAEDGVLGPDTIRAWQMFGAPNAFQYGSSIVRFGPIEENGVKYSGKWFNGKGLDILTMKPDPGKPSVTVWFYDGEVIGLVASSVGLGAPKPNGKGGFEEFTETWSQDYTISGCEKGPFESSVFGEAFIQNFCAMVGEHIYANIGLHGLFNVKTGKHNNAAIHATRESGGCPRLSEQASAKIMELVMKELARNRMVSVRVTGTDRQQRPSKKQAAALAKQAAFDAQVTLITGAQPANS